MPGIQPWATARISGFDDNRLKTTGNPRKLHTKAAKRDDRRLVLSGIVLKFPELLA